ncbi:hypothetical protein RI367_004805 [Sorochytrium milnesiophthora]
MLTSSVIAVCFCSSLAASASLFLLVLHAVQGAQRLPNMGLVSRMQAVDIASRVVSTAHAMLVVWAALRFFNTDWMVRGTDVYDAVFRMTSRRAVLLSCSLAYFVFDLGILAVYWLEWAAATASHAAARAILAAKSWVGRQWHVVRSWSSRSAVSGKRKSAALAAIRRHQKLAGETFTAPVVSSRELRSAIKYRRLHQQSAIYEDIPVAVPVASASTADSGHSNPIGTVTNGLYLCSMTAHHVGIISAFTMSLHYGFAGKYMCVLLLNEMSTPFLNARALLHHFHTTLGMGSSTLVRRLRYANLVTLCVTFFFSRVVLNGLVLAHIVWACSWYWPSAIERGMSPVTAAACIAVLVSHTVLNVLWFARLLRMSAATFTVGTSWRHSVSAPVAVEPIASGEQWPAAAKPLSPAVDQATQLLSQPEE